MLQVPNHALRFVYAYGTIDNKNSILDGEIKILFLRNFSGVLHDLLPSPYYGSIEVLTYN